ncbi:APH(3') family aminoglycoside O-phosphotransferase [Lihuaxuella thermophila]|uniref:Kanamycin kinase/aminoglycoside 3'-phosphotransferase-2 n=1 Tax=Lihuaxuella thermophila TaxID=1173111 RepID=A0A1H8FIN2_9BACL|nr:APH(3') family aminoglycoside O-phosphotransferase [Lihuaxuella thermophila]SEN31506.1 kanamycin kinase/aminoglycoside 3'-phosphotransferase-2 [Lihuaxuella thermophila]
MIDSLPEEISLFVRNMNWRKDTVGRSGDEVYQLTSKTQHYYLKIKSEPGTELLKLESQVLNWLKGKLPVPEVVCYHNDSFKEYLLITEVPGLMASDPGWQDKKKVVRSLAEGLRWIHSLPIETCPFSYPAGLLVQAAGERVRLGMVDEDDFDPCRMGKRAAELYEELVRSEPVYNDEVFTHGDYCLPNVILSPSGVSGFIDWARGGAADRYRDLGIAARSIADNFGDTYIPYFFEAYELKAIDEEKIKFFQLLDEFF